MDTVIPYETARNYHYEEIEKTVELKQQDDNAPKKKALDRSLDEIMQQEKNDMQSHLSLFNQSQKGDNKENLMYKFPEMSLLPDPVINDEDEMDEIAEHMADLGFSIWYTENKKREPEQKSGREDHNGI